MISDTLEQDGLISFGIGKEAKKITLHYISSPAEYENSNSIEIVDFDDFYTYYDRYCGEKVKECVKCGKMIVPKGSSPIKYCEDCSHKKQLQHKRNYKNKH